MLHDTQRHLRKVPSLIYYCQRVAVQHAEGLHGLGDLPYSLLQPILESCSPDTLARVEDASPHVTSETSDLWRGFCFKTYPQASEEALEDETDADDFWRDHFFNCRSMEAKRLEEIGSKIRSQRREAEKQKKEKEIKITDRLPPPKRQRGWPTGPAPPKSLFQKTRVAASRVQRVFGAPSLAPPMIPGKGYPKLNDGNSNTKLDYADPTAGSFSNLTASPPTATKPVTVRTVATYRKVPNPTSTVTSSTTPVPAYKNTSSLLMSSSPPLPTFSRKNPPVTSSSSPLPQSTNPSNSKPLRPKNDPMAKLFMPKHRAHSQLPGRQQSLSSR